MYRARDSLSFLRAFIVEYLDEDAVKFVVDKEELVLSEEQSDAVRLFRQEAESIVSRLLEKYPASSKNDFRIVEIG